MVQLLNYIDAIYSIRHPEFVNGTNITTTDMPSIHKAILSKAFDDGNRSALIFENELYYTIPISDLNNNVLKYFLLNNTTWDMMILSPHTDLTTTPVDGYANINLLTGNTFHADKIYLASRRLMAKAKNNNMSNIVTFYYSFNFIRRKFNIINQVLF